MTPSPTIAEVAAEGRMKEKPVNDIYQFVKESNRIEGILRAPYPMELDAHLRFLSLPNIVIDDLELFVGSIQPDAVLRSKPHLNVRVAEHIAPRGGAAIVSQLNRILSEVPNGDPYEVHQQYETLHPFTDGNGRSGRAVWLWMMDKRGEIDRALAIGFLHCWYYQSLSEHRK